MSAIKILAAVYMLLVAAAVAVNFIAILFYDPPLGGGWFAYSSLSDPDPVLGDAGLTAWQILDPLMVAGVIMGLDVCFRCKAPPGLRLLQQGYRPGVPGGQRYFLFLRSPPPRPPLELDFIAVGGTRRLQWSALGIHRYHPALPPRLYRHPTPPPGPGL